MRNRSLIRTKTANSVPSKFLGLGSVEANSGANVNVKLAGGHSKSRNRTKAQGLLGKYNQSNSVTTTLPHCSC